MGKSRLGPVKPRTIPGLKLSAITTAVRLDTMIKEESDVGLDTSVYWTDSTSLLRYLNNEKNQFRTSVANRIFVIGDASQNPTNGTMSVLNVTQQTMLPEV